MRCLAAEDAQTAADGRHPSDLGALPLQREAPRRRQRVEAALQWILRQAGGHCSVLSIGDGQPERLAALSVAAASPLVSSKVIRLCPASSACALAAQLDFLARKLPAICLAVGPLDAVTVLTRTKKDPLINVALRTRDSY